MAKIRSISPNACESVRLGQITDGAERLYWRLQTHCDDDGRHIDDPRVIWGACCIQIAGWTAELVDQLLDELHTIGLVHRYQVDGRHYLEVDQFTRFQHPKYRQKSTLPPRPDDDQGGTTSPPDRPPIAPRPKETTGDETTQDVIPGAIEPLSPPDVPHGEGEGVGEGVGEPPTSEVTHTAPRLTVVAGGQDQQRPDRRTRVGQAILHLAQLELNAEITKGRTIDDRATYLDAIVRRLSREAASELHHLAHEHPTATGEQLADLHRGDHLRITTPADQSRTLATIERRPSSTACSACSGRGRTATEDGTIAPCPACQPAPTPA